MPAPLRTSPQAWIAAGLHALAAGGPDAVRVEALAKSLGVTKGSFYGHFADRGAFLDAVLDEWERSSVSEVIEDVDASSADPRARLKRLFALAGAGPELLHADLAVRDWARRDEAVAERLRRVDNRRMSYMRELFSALGVDAEEAEARALMTFSLWIGPHFIAADHGDRERGAVVGHALARLLQPPG